MPYKSKLNHLKSLHFDDSIVKLFALKRHLKERKAVFTILCINVDSKLGHKLISIVKKNIEKCKTVEEYSYITEELEDDEVLSLNYEETDFKPVLEKIIESSECKVVDKIEDLIKTTAYAIHLAVPDKDKYIDVITITKIPETWDMVKQNSLVAMIFKGQKFVDLENTTIFGINTKVDFLYFEKSLLIMNKKSFENVMSFREGMIDNRDDLLEELKDLNIVDDIEIIKNFIENNIKLLRKAASIKKDNKYSEVKFMENVKDVLIKYGWAEIDENGRIIITEENVETVIKILNNERVEALVDKKFYDAPSKKPVN